MVLRERADAHVVAVGVERDVRGLAHEDDAVGGARVAVDARLQVVGLVREEGRALLAERAEHGPDASEVVRHRGPAIYFNMFAGRVGIN